MSKIHSQQEGKRSTAWKGRGQGSNTNLQEGMCGQYSNPFLYTLNFRHCRMGVFQGTVHGSYTKKIITCKLSSFFSKL